MAVRGARRQRAHGAADRQPARARLQRGGRRPRRARPTSADAVRARARPRAAFYVGGALRLDATLDHAPVLGDPVLLERMAANLVENAVRYNGAIGWVRVWSGIERGEAVAAGRELGREASTRRRAHGRARAVPAPGVLARARHRRLRPRPGGRPRGGRRPTAGACSCMRVREGGLEVMVSLPPRATADGRHPARLGPALPQPLPRAGLTAARTPSAARGAVSTSACTPWARTVPSTHFHSTMALGLVRERLPVTGSRSPRRVQTAGRQLAVYLRSAGDLAAMRGHRPAVALAALTLAAGVAACGSSQLGAGDTALSRDRRRRRAERGQAGHGQEGRHAHGDQRRRRRLRRPGQVYYAFGYMVHYAVNRAPVLLRPGRHEKPRADLAIGEPQISADQKTVTVRLKPGRAYAPPVNREVTAGDVKYALRARVQRARALPYAGVYFKDIEGAPGTPGDIEDIPGIQTPDDHTIVFKLTSPAPRSVAGAGDADLDARARGVRAQVRRQDAVDLRPVRRLHRARTCTRTTPRASSSGASRASSIELVRNPNWDAKTDYRPAFLDSITVQEGNSRLGRLGAADPRRPGDGPGRRHHAGADHQAGALAQP